MTGPAFLSATATYPAGWPAEDLPEMLKAARTLGARVQIDTGSGDLHVLLTVNTETESVFAIGQELAVLTDALPTGAKNQSSTFRHTGPVPF